MNSFDRRAFLRASAGALVVSQIPQIAFAAAAPAACVTSGLPSFLPNRLTVDCASKRNFQIYRKNPDYMGLTGVVSMTTVRGQYGSYPAGNLFLFPWLNQKGIAFGLAKDWGAVAPASGTQFFSAAPIRGATLAQDEYFCRLVLQVPTQAFIGFEAGLAPKSGGTFRPWRTDVEKLADGKGIGVGWTSANLNGPWFGGSRWIPDADTCNGKSWRKLIISALSDASAGATCSA